MATPGSSHSAATTRKTVEDFGLVRESTVWEPKDTTFIDPYLILASIKSNPFPSSASAPEWRSFKITQPCPGGSPRLLNGYAVSPSHHAYVTFCVQLTATDAARDPVRLTEMRYRDMIVENYISASMSLPTSISKLRWLGVANIVSKPSRSTFHQLFHLAERGILLRGSVGIEPSSLHGEIGKQMHGILLNDPFARGVLALLHHCAQHIGYAFVKRFICLSEGYEGHQFSGYPSPLELRLSLVVELARPGNDEITDASPLANP
jgi:hypothetical protein